MIFRFNCLLELSRTEQLGRNVFNLHSYDVKKAALESIEKKSFTIDTGRMSRNGEGNA